jgi:DNA-directed RNA polymerase specialized sigma24 family protein
MNDRELMIQAKKGNREAMDTLWKQYEMLVHKQWHVLRRQMNNSSLIKQHEGDFYSDAYISFRKAVDAVDLKKIRDDNWKLLGYFKWYLQTLRNNTIKHLLQVNAHEESLYIFDAESQTDMLRPDVERLEHVDVPAEIDMKESLGKISANWSPKRKYVLQRRLEGVPKKEIAEEMGNHPAMVTFLLRGMKKDLDKKL